MKNIFISIIYIAFSFSSKANVNDDFSKGNDLYKKQQYSDAIGCYKKVINDGYQIAEVYYNIGNCYFKLDSIAKAILFYEKAKKINPNDISIKHNIATANKFITDKIEKKTTPFSKQILETLTSSRTTDKWAQNCVIMLFITFVLLAIFILSERSFLKKFSFWTASLSLLIAIISWYFASYTLSKLNSHTDAIVMASAIEVKSAPESEAKNLFIIHAGCKAEIINRLNNWVEIKIADNYIGWVPIETIAEI